MMTKIPPQSLTAEMSVLGSMLLSPVAIEKAMGVLSDYNFYKVSHSKIYSAIVALYKREEPVDLITLTEELQSQKELDNIGGVTYLSELLNNTPTSANIDYYCEIVKEKYLQRKLIYIGSEIINKAYDEKLMDTISIGQTNLDNLINQLKVGEWYSTKELLTEHYEYLANKSEKIKQGEMFGYTTGYCSLDFVLGGLQKKDLIIVAGRPSMGKSALILNILYNLAKKNIASGLFSLESSKESLMDRLLAIDSNIKAHCIRTGTISEEDFKVLNKSMERFFSNYAPIFINDIAGLSVMDIECAALKMIKQGAKIIVIDYVQLIRSIEREENRTRELSAISVAIKQMAKRLAVPIILLSQLNRNVEYRANKRPLLSDLRDSGKLEEDADVVMFLYRDDYYNPESQEQGVTEIKIAKHREGQTGFIKLKFLKEYIRFENLDGIGG